MLFAQLATFKAPVKINQSVNTGLEETMPLLSYSGDTLFFSRSASKTSGKGGMDIWYSVKSRGGKWGKAKNDLEGLNNKKDNYIIGIARNGKRHYLLNTYQSLKRKRYGVAYSDYVDGNWSSPQSAGLVVKTKGEFGGFYMHPSEDLVMTSMHATRSQGGKDIYVILKNEKGSWGKPINLGKGINTEDIETSPYLSRDKKVLYFSSAGHPGFGNTDVFMAERLDDTWTNWSTPVNLGKDINTAGDNTCFLVKRNGIVYFVSHEEKGAGDIYFSRLLSPVESELGVEEDLVEYELKAGEQPNDSLGKVELEEWVVQKVTILFKFNSDEVLDMFSIKLGEIIDYFKSNTGYTIKLIGHTDDVGDASYNEKLSLKRAKALKDYFVRRGVDEDKIHAEGRGEAEPAAQNDSEDGRYLNRRVEVSLENKNNE